MDTFNPWACGYYGYLVKACTSINSTITCCQKRITGTLLDCIDIHIEVPIVEYEKFSDDRLGEPSADVHLRVENARQFQWELFVDHESASHLEGATQSIACNADSDIQSTSPGTKPNPQPAQGCVHYRRSMFNS
ncbi:ATP-binding protein [Chloroflexota bacterium]